MSTVTYPKIIGIEDTSSGALDGKLVRTSRFVQIGSGTSGTITLPPNSTVVLNDFGGTVDAVVAQMSGGRPTYSSAVDGSSVVISTTFDSAGAYVFSGTPSAYPVALVYRVEQTLLDFDSTASDIVGSPQISGGGSGGITTIEDGVTTTTGFGANEIIFSDGSVTRGNSKFTYNPTTNLFQVTDGTDRFLRVSPTAKTFAIGDLDGAGPYIESNLSSNELQLVANILEMGGNRYTYPAVQGTAGQVLSVDSVALGVATLEWVAGGGSITGAPNSVPYFDGTGAIQSSATKISYDDTTYDLSIGDSNGNTNFHSAGTGQEINFLDINGNYGTAFGQLRPTLLNFGGDIGGAGQGSAFVISYNSGKAALGDVSGLITGDSINIDFVNSQFDVKNAGGRFLAIDLVAGKIETGDIDGLTSSLITTVDPATEIFQVSSSGNRLFQVDGASRIVSIGDISNAFGSGVLSIDYDNNIMAWTNAARFDINGQTMSWPASTAAGLLSNDGAGNLSWAAISGVTTIGTLDGNGASAGGASIVTNSLFMQSASASRAGIVNTTTQVFNGLKAFNTGMEMSQGAITATAGAGYLDFFTQSSTPAAPSASFLRLWQQSNRMFFSRNGGIDASLDFNAITVDRNFVFPDVAGTVVITSGTSATATGGAVAAPALVEGYITIRVGGVNKKIPYYAN